METTKERLSPFGTSPNEKDKSFPFRLFLDSSTQGASQEEVLSTFGALDHALNTSSLTITGKEEKTIGRQSHHLSSPSPFKETRVPQFASINGIYHHKLVPSFLSRKVTRPADNPMRHTLSNFRTQDCFPRKSDGLFLSNSQNQLKRISGSQDGRSFIVVKDNLTSFSQNVSPFQKRQRERDPCTKRTNSEENNAKKDQIRGKLSQSLEPKGKIAQMNWSSQDQKKTKENMFISLSPCQAQKKKWVAPLKKENTVARSIREFGFRVISYQLSKMDQNPKKKMKMFEARNKHEMKMKEDVVLNAETVKWANEILTKSLLKGNSVFSPSFLGNTIGETVQRKPSIRRRTSSFYESSGDGSCKEGQTVKLEEPIGLAPATQVDLQENQGSRKYSFRSIQTKGELAEEDNRGNGVEESKKKKEKQRRLSIIVPSEEGKEEEINSRKSKKRISFAESETLARLWQNSNPEKCPSEPSVFIVPRKGRMDLSETKESDKAFLEFYRLLVHYRIHSERLKKFLNEFYRGQREEVSREALDGIVSNNHFLKSIRSQLDRNNYARFHVDILNVNEEAILALEFLNKKLQSFLVMRREATMVSFKKEFIQALDEVESKGDDLAKTKRDSLPAWRKNTEETSEVRLDLKRSDLGFKSQKVISEMIQDFERKNGKIEMISRDTKKMVETFGETCEDLNNALVI